ncbi:hypothetical protein RB195_021745 [Necator americanus]|uniref:Uncharacterized protein n=1 Tax=Necator americanus TaxID=51031 RepID=A0ABR1ECQ5_NECAM
MKEDLRTIGVDKQFRRDVVFCRIWNSDEWIDSVQALAEDREGDDISPPIKSSESPTQVKVMDNWLRLLLASLTVSLSVF